MTASWPIQPTQRNFRHVRRRVPPRVGLHMRMKRGSCAAEKQGEDCPDLSPKPLCAARSVLRRLMQSRCPMKRRKKSRQCFRRCLIMRPQFPLKRHWSKSMKVFRKCSFGKSMNREWPMPNVTRRQMWTGSFFQKFVRTGFINPQKQQQLRLRLRLNFRLRRCAKCSWKRDSPCHARISSISLLSIL